MIYVKMQQPCQISLVMLTQILHISIQTHSLLPLQNEQFVLKVVLLKLHLVLLHKQKVQFQVHPHKHRLHRPKQKKQPELDHARNYVRKIKLRFESKPEIYKSFLRILHTFHEEHHTIKDVYEQVATLFRSHPDLLSEFKQFLPDKSAVVEESPRGSRRSRQTSRTRRKAAADSYSPRHTPSANDYNFFESAKSQLRNESYLYNDFMKILNLYNEDVLTRVDLLLMTRELFSEYPELYEEFRQFCDFSDVGNLPEPRRRSSPSPSPNRIDFRCEIDVSTCKSYGPSYRGFPAEYVRPTCSGRTELCNEVLNDDWFSVPTGSEEGFKASLKNQYEENLFGCEDKRHELDMAIELNRSTIQRLLPVAKDISLCDEDDLPQFQLQDGLDILHLRTIELIYGAKSYLILQGICENPVVTIPTVLRRLQQKNAEWQTTRSLWNSIWQEAQEKNYYRSLDHQSAQFKVKEKKLLNPRELLAEIKNDCFDNSSPSNGTPSYLAAPAALPTVLSFHIHNDRSVFSDIEGLIEFQAQRMYNSDVEPEKLQNFNSFIRQFFLILDANSTKQPLSAGMFFGNNSFYVFFRFYQMLHERLVEAKKMAEESFTKAPAPVNDTKQLMCAKLVTKSKRIFKDTSEKYQFFLEDMLRPVIEGELDPVKYEDLCRELFGISSYVLFTMDRLLQVLVKQILSIFLEDTSSKLFSLHSFEAARSNGFLESIYHTNALNITGEERCFKFNYLLPDGTFTIQVLDSTTGIVDLPKEKFSKPTPTDCNDVQPEQTEPDAPHSVFLLRNKVKIAKSSLVNKHVVANNGLECKICTKTYRHFYVEETEDYFYRTGQLTRARNKQITAKIERLHKWVDARLQSLS
mmetsp:Transcript_41164/g.63431  ORF Transcript_41164/g.63431 Transcript_41164/m.63431 type:complete len:860 (-) Transcript_41164:67-2646(-)